MATELADAERLDSGGEGERTVRPPVSRGDDGAEDDGLPMVARGVFTAMLISAPVWVLIAFAVYLWR